MWEHSRKHKIAIATRSLPVSSLPSSEPKQLDILSDIIGLSTVEEALVMPCSKHGERLRDNFLDCVFKSSRRIKEKSMKEADDGELVNCDKR